MNKDLQQGFTYALQQASNEIDYDLPKLINQYWLGYMAGLTRAKLIVSEHEKEPTAGATATNSDK